MAGDFFGEEVAAVYDESEADMFDTSEVDPTADFLAELAGDGEALELGIGTGRIALPLAARGIAVSAIYLSETMVARLRGKPGGQAIPVEIGDFATTKLGRTFAVIYLVFNTIMNLTTAEEQLACFGTVADQLKPGGKFVVEVMMPQLQRLAPGGRVVVRAASDRRLALDEYDVVSQRLTSRYYSFLEGGVEERSIPFRYAWPSELDLMARLAGLRLSQRWAGWKREPFTSESTKHVSVWEKAGP